MNNQKVNLSMASFVLSLITVGVQAVFKAATELLKTELPNSIQLLDVAVVFALALVSVVLSIKGRAQNSKADKKQNSFGLAGFIIGLVFGGGALEALFIQINDSFLKFSQTVFFAVEGVIVAAMVAVAIVSYVRVAKKSQ